jgi:hypothetical protein
MTLKPWFQKASDQITQDELSKMSRQQAFDRGLLTVQDLDDEELRAGRCRGPDGKIPVVTGKTSTIPRDIFDEVVAEHEQRTNQRLRERLDTMVDVIVGVAIDDTVEPRDRFEAAKYVFERLAGKTPERINVAVTRAPWEEMLMGIAKVTREESHARRLGNAIDAEVVDTDSGADSNLDPASKGFASDGEMGPDGFGSGPDSPHMAPAGFPEAKMPGPTVPDEVYEYTYEPATPVESHNEPGNTSATIPHGHNADAGPPDKPQWADLVAEQKELAERRKQARDRIKIAKKKRIIKRTLGLDAWDGTDITTEEHDQGDGTFNVEFKLR